jgi:hypothetical protein
MKEIFDKLKHSPIHNYILPGLTSWVFSALRETLDNEAQIQVSGIIGSVL